MSIYAIECDFRQAVIYPLDRISIDGNPAHIEQGIYWNS